MAGRANLTFLGQDDINLTGTPQITYFVERYAGQTMFASRVDQVIFNQDSVAFGSENYVILPRSGDLITNMYLKVEFPSSIPSVLDSAGTLMIDSIELYVGSELVERLYGEHIEMRYDLELPVGKQGALIALIGKNLSNAGNIPNAVYTIPLQFSLLRKGLPLCAFQEDVTIRIKWNQTNKFTIPSMFYTAPFCSYLHVEYTYLDQPEIDFIKKSNRVMLIEQVQRNEFFAPAGLNSIRCLLDFYNPVKELFFVIQNDTAPGYDYTLTGNADDQLLSLELNFNTTDRISLNVGTPLFLSVIQPLEFHTRVPDRFFYMYSFSLDPENEDPSGSANFSLIKNQILNLNLNNNNKNRNIRIYAINYNFFLTSGDHGSMIYSNFK